MEVIEQLRLSEIHTQFMFLVRTSVMFVKFLFNVLKNNIWLSVNQSSCIYSFCFGMCTFFLLFVIKRKQRYIWNILSECNAEAHVWNINVYPKGSALELQTPCKIGCWPKNKLAGTSPDFVEYLGPVTPLQSSACANCCLSYAIQVRILNRVMMVLKKIEYIFSFSS